MNSISDMGSQHPTVGLRAVLDAAQSFAPLPEQQVSIAGIAGEFFYFGCRVRVTEDGPNHAVELLVAAMEVVSEAAGSIIDKRDARSEPPTTNGEIDG